MPFPEIYGLILVICNVGGCVVLPSKLLHRSSDVVDRPSDITRLDIEFVPKLLCARVQTSFCLPNPVDANLLDDVHSRLNLSFVHK
eukprot:11388057-Heterocapsa_arctica.AAC.1